MVNNVNEAVSILVQGVEIATKAGVFSLNESRYIVEAIEFLNPTYFTGAQESVPDSPPDVSVETSKEESIPVVEEPQNVKKQKSYNL